MLCGSGKILRAMCIAVAGRGNYFPGIPVSSGRIRRRGMRSPALASARQKLKATMVSGLQANAGPESRQRCTSASGPVEL
jgi:hypothetical protein